ncbi:MAG: peroxiredoxin family protein [Thermodesulfovibrionales bacterium]
MKFNRFIFCLLIVPVLCAAACSRGTQTGQQPPAIAGGKAPDFTLRDLKGKDVRLADYSGKVVLLEFWATWCPPCRASVPEFIALQSRYRDKNVVILAVSLDEGKDVIAKLADFVREQKINYTILVGSESVSQAYNVKSIPALFIIDKSGMIVSTQVGYAGDLTAQIDKVL